MLNFSIDNILDSISYNPTPIGVAIDMISLLDDKGFFNKPDDNISMRDYIETHRVLDIFCKSGVFLLVCYYKFSSVLSSKFKTLEDLDYFICRYLLYGVCPSLDVAYLLSRKFYSSNSLLNKDNTILGNFHIANRWGTDINNYIPKELRGMRFDVVVGNPPYNNDMYLDFVRLGHNLSKGYSLWITPAKFIAKNDNRGLNKAFRETMIPFISDLFLYIHTHEVFSILSDGGIAYYICDKSIHTGTKVTNICNEIPAFIDSKCVVVKNKDLSRYSPINISDSILEKLFKLGFKQYIPGVVDESDYNYYLTSQFGGSGAPTNRFFATDGKSLVLSNYEILGRGRSPKSKTVARLFSGSKVDCEYFHSWIYSKFVRFLLVCGMCTRSSVSVESWRFVPDPIVFDKLYEDRPLDGYIPDSNGEYIDKDGVVHCSLYIKYDLTADEIKVIESTIRDRVIK